MILTDAWQGKSYAVYGLARSGLASVEALVRSGCTVACWDDDEDARAKASPWADRVDFVEDGLHGYDALVVSPGVPIDRHRIADRAREAGCAIIGDIELFARARASLPDHHVVAITGTNGKSTTTALIAHIFNEAGRPAVAAGNIGEPILSLDPLAAGGVYVLELSSYQIDLTHGLDADVAILLNVTPDHLDRYHGNFDAYRASKERLFAMQSDDSVAIDMRGIDTDDVATRGWSEALSGPHNRQNGGAAILACSALGLDRAQIEAGLASFEGLAHRMERVAVKNGVTYINDSKATNPAAAAPALGAFHHIRWIAGGEAKEDHLDDVMPYLDRIEIAYLIGDAEELFARLLDGKVPVKRCNTLAAAFEAAQADAKDGDTILLSPACASFDQYKDFTARGDEFKTLVGLS